MSTESGPNTRRTSAVASVSGDTRRIPSTSPTNAAYMRAIDRALVMPLAAGISARHTSGRFHSFPAGEGPAGGGQGTTQQVVGTEEHAEHVGQRRCRTARFGALSSSGTNPGGGPNGITGTIRS